MGATGPDSAESPVDNRILDAAELKELYSYAINQDARVMDLLRVLDAIIARDSKEDLTTTDLLSAISSLRDLILANTKEIQYLHLLVAKLIYTLLQNDLEVDDKELLNEMNQYLKFK